MGWEFSGLGSGSRHIGLRVNSLGCSVCVRFSGLGSGSGGLDCGVSSVKLTCLLGEGTNQITVWELWIFNLHSL